MSFDQHNKNKRDDEGLVAVNISACSVAGNEKCQAALFFRRGDEIVIEKEPFTPFLLIEKKSIPNDLPEDADVRELKGPGNLNVLVRFSSLKDWRRAKTGLAKNSSSNASILAINDFVNQHLLLTGRSLFKGLPFAKLRRMQVDIETHTAPGFDFCNPEREADRIIIIAMGDESGWEMTLGAPGLSEKKLLEEFIALVKERDPDVIEGHNIFNFDLPYIATRAARHGVELDLGRDGSTMRSSPSRFTAGDNIIPYSKFEIAGRNIVDTLFLLRIYDASHRVLESCGLKQAAAHFKLSSPNRVFIDGSKISEAFELDPERVLRYATDDIRETRALSDLLSPSSFIQAGMLPFSYQTTCLRGTASKIDAMMVREYLREERAIPLPARPKRFQGGYTDIFMRGVIKNVHHCDIRSLYPSIMLAHKIAPRSDRHEVFLKLLEQFKDMRLDAKRKMKATTNESSRTHFDALQNAMKIFINSFYGYLGFAQGRFNDFEAAERVAAEGRAILENMVNWLREHAAEPIEIDTDGVYFVPPVFTKTKEAFQKELQDSLPKGIEVEFDGEYTAMFSYKMKNYALLDASGKIIIRGAALKSRGMEPYLRDFLKDLIRIKLECRDDELPGLKERFEKAVLNEKMDIRKLAKMEVLKDAPAKYAEKIAGKHRGRNAAYEIALRSNRPYQAGDQISYYIAGTEKSASIFRAAKPVSEWVPSARDENKAYYIAKLNALYEKFITGESFDSSE